MGLFRIIGAYALAVVTTFLLAAFFYTQQVIAKQAAFGAGYTLPQQVETYIANTMGLAALYAPMLAVALLIGFAVAAILKRILKPLSTIAYPLAGAASVLVLLYLIENVVIPGGVGAIGGARDLLGVSLQGLAGALGGLVFAMTRGVR